MNIYLKVIGGGLGLSCAAIYGKMYFEVYKEKSKVATIMNDITIKENKKIEISSQINNLKTSLSDLEITGNKQIKEQEEIKMKIKKNTNILDKLKNELKAINLEFKNTQLKLKDTNNRINNLYVKETETNKHIEKTKADLEVAISEFENKKKSMEFQNLPLIKNFFSEKN